MSFVAKDSQGRKFPTKKALITLFKDGGPQDVVFRDLGYVHPRAGGSSFYRDGLRAGDTIEGPDPEREANKWYARVEMDKQGNPTIR